MQQHSLARATEQPEATDEVQRNLNHCHSLLERLQQEVDAFSQVNSPNEKDHSAGPGDASIFFLGDDSRTSVAQTSEIFFLAGAVIALAIDT